MFDQRTSVTDELIWENGKIIFESLNTNKLENLKIEMSLSNAETQSKDILYIVNQEI